MSPPTYRELVAPLMQPGYARPPSATACSVTRTNCTARTQSRTHVLHHGQQVLWPTLHYDTRGSDKWTFDLQLHEPHFQWRQKGNQFLITSKNEQRQPAQTYHLTASTDGAMAALHHETQQRHHTAHAPPQHVRRSHTQNVESQTQNTLRLPLPVDIRLSMECFRSSRSPARKRVTNTHSPRLPCARSTQRDHDTAATTRTPRREDRRRTRTRTSHSRHLLSHNRSHQQSGVNYPLSFSIVIGDTSPTSMSPTYRELVAH
jgi:hypothetical protein